MKNTFALTAILTLVLASCGDGNNHSNGDDNKSNSKTTLTVINMALGNFELTYGTVVFKFTDSDEVTKEVNAGTNFVYINDLVLTNYMKELGISGEATYRTVESITCEKDKNNLFTLMDNTIVTIPGGYKGSGDITDTMKNVQDILLEYLRKDAKGFNKTQTWFFDLIENFNNAPDGTTHTITLTDSFEFPAGGNYRNSSGWRTLFKEGQNKKIVIQGDTNVRTITNNGKTLDGYYQLDAGGYLFIVSDGITLELGKNIVLNGNGIDFPVIYVEENGTFIMNNGSTISGNSANAVSSYGTFTMNGGTIKNNNSNKYNSIGAVSMGGGGVIIYGGTFTMNEGIIRENTVYGNGGGVLVDSGTFIMNGGTISGNKVIEPLYSLYSYGGGVCTLINGSFIKTGGTIDNTNEADEGKVAYVATNGTQKRETAAGPTDNLDSSKTGSAGGWE